MSRYWKSWLIHSFTSCSRQDQWFWIVTIAQSQSNLWNDNISTASAWKEDHHCVSDSVCHDSETGCQVSRGRVLRSLHGSLDGEYIGALMQVGPLRSWDMSSRPSWVLNLECPGPWSGGWRRWRESFAWSYPDPVLAKSTPRSATSCICGWDSHKIWVVSLQ